MMYVVQIDMHHTCLALRPTCGSFNCTTQLGQHLQPVADRPNTHAINDTSRTGNTAISTRYIGGTLCDRHDCIIHVLQVLSGMQWLLPWCTACCPSVKLLHVFSQDLAARYTAYAALHSWLRCLTCANLLRIRSRLYSRAAVLQWHHTQTGMQLSVVRACPGSHDRGARCI
jgi:hypothetical protein